jgi:putative glutamine amidotransferase
MAERIAECVLRAGGEPLVLAPGDPERALERLGTFDGLLVPGGGDLDPALYTDEPRHEASDDPDAVQDAADIAVMRAAVAAAVPTLAICRGMQVLNVALGGTLTQHLDDDGMHRDAIHRVELEPGSRLARVMGAHAVDVSSYHHQSVDRLAPGLRVVGRAADGCIEALEHVEAPVLAVQWHPEDDAHLAAAQQALFDDLVVRSAAFRPMAEARS